MNRFSLQIHSVGYVTSWIIMHGWNAREFVLFSVLIAVTRQIGVLVEHFNFRSSERTNFSCSRIHNITIEDTLLDDWHCIGGALAKYNQPGMWVITKGSLAVATEEDHISLVIAYTDDNIQASFDLGDTIHERMESSAVFYLEIVRRREKGSITPTFIPFDDKGQLATEPPRRMTAVNVTMSYFLYADEPSPTNNRWTKLTLLIAVVVEGLIIVVLLVSVCTCCCKWDRPDHNEVEMLERQNPPTEARSACESQLVE
ncbi:hypothetical protein Y032_0185g1030 [Ancylostoma ceylanicum]|uniref:Uncharacterized protein n=1 Tax=Ancylostoma ceylanicum TaxID=53326 RepID=A0A016SR59_9BILA|nr:hypothetical protein Y032_0185g1030 [Ancylostoma ceylanicum]